MENLACMCTGFAVVETQISMRPIKRVDVGGRTYSGRDYPEDPARVGAALDAEDSFWLTRASLLNLMSDTGFSSVFEVLNPVVPELAEYEDHVTFVGFRGDCSVPSSIPGLAGAERDRWPEKLDRRTHPTQAAVNSVPFLRRIACTVNT